MRLIPFEINDFLLFLTYMEKETNVSFIPPADQFFDIIDLDCLWRQNIKETDLFYEYNDYNNQFYRMRILIFARIYFLESPKNIFRVYLFSRMDV